MRADEPDDGFVGDGAVMLSRAEYKHIDAERRAYMDYIVTAEFSLSVKGLIDSRFVSAMDIGLVKEIIDTALGFGSDEETEEDAETAPEQPPAAEPAPPPPAIEPAYPTPAPAPEMPAQQYPQSPYPQQQTYTAKPPYPQQPYYPPQQYYYTTAVPI